MLTKGNKKYLSYAPTNLEFSLIILLEKTEVKKNNPKDGLRAIAIISTIETIPIPTPDPAKDMVDSLTSRNLVFCNEIIYNLKKNYI